MAKKETKTEGATKARILVDCNLGNVNDVVEISEEQVTAALEAGLIDVSDEAVAYAESLQG